ncbi:MAG: Uma2 family endonuclease [Anaerolineae bacterium]|nr:Uma2 family endonuclease [Candidatus Roseilinea sp.]MDW8450710.1 Uma2 family endonuclease [Anaerolineae bacterium]
MAAHVTLRPISVSEYARMREAGILAEDDRVELIAGEIRQMSPIGPLHASVVRRLTKLLASLVGDTASVSVQNPIQLDDYSEPIPDIAILKSRDDEYASQHPKGQDTLIVIEVADTTADYDRKEKIPRYASAGIPEAWLVDIANQVIEQYTLPGRSRYQNVRILEWDDTLTAQALPGLQIKVEQVFGP